MESLKRSGYGTQDCGLHLFLSTAKLPAGKGKRGEGQDHRFTEEPQRAQRAIWPLRSRPCLCLPLWQDQGQWLGYLQDYPDYWTQGESFEDLQTSYKDLCIELSLPWSNHLC